MYLSIYLSTYIYKYTYVYIMYIYFFFPLGWHVDLIAPDSTTTSPSEVVRPGTLAGEAREDSSDQPQQAEVDRGRG